MSTLVESTSIGTVAVEIGGVPILLNSEDASFHAMVQRQYAGFLRTAEAATSGSAPVQFDIEMSSADVLSGYEDVRVWKESGGWHAERSDFRAEFSLESARGRIQQELKPYGLNSVLRIVHSIYLASQHGFLLHAASAIRNHSAFIFSGVSGAGKTTISRCAPGDVTLLTDEISYIRRKDDGYDAWGTPFTGDLGTPGENIRAPIARLFFLEKGASHQIQDLKKTEAIRLLLRNILFFCADGGLVGQLFHTACNFVERVPVHRLTFAPDATVWDLIS